MSAIVSSSSERADTVLDRLIEHLRARDAALDGQERPAAVLWTDPRGEWLPLIETMKTRAAELLVLGDYAPDARTGPAIWLRGLVDKALKEPVLPDNRAPILYLPRVGRQSLTAGEDCPQTIRPLVELMFRGTLWLQHNGSDWTVMAFLTSKKTLRLDIVRDNTTSEALLRALPEIALTPVEQLREGRLEADDFDRMLSGDVVRDVLRWMGDADGTQARLGESGWGAFCNRAREELNFDPSVEADVVAGERMGVGEGAWARVWERFVESPNSFGDIAALLRRSRPPGKLPFNREPWPDLNAEDEQSVRIQLEKALQLSLEEAGSVILQLDQAHRERRSWVWARMGLSPMAEVLLPLSRLAHATSSTIGGTTLTELASAYVDRGWQGDAASWEAIAMTPTADEPLVSKLVNKLLAPWLDASARAFQDAVKRSPLPERGEQIVIEAEDDGCIFFCDGLRYDLGRRLAERLEGRGCRVTVGHRWAASPTVTATAKPAITPVADTIGGITLGSDFAARLLKKDRPADAPNMRDAIKESGYQMLGTGAFDAPLSHPAHGWLEEGHIDDFGHKLNLRLVGQINEELERLTERIVGLLDSGWKKVRVVTDHGWLLLPDGLPKVDLPKHLTESRWARCAVIAGDATPDVLRFPWYWSPDQSFATAPGIACFNKSPVYAHGGLSVQECLTPDILVDRSDEVETSASVKSITWRALRCYVEASIEGVGVTADLRLERPSGASVAAATKPVEDDGTVSLVLAGDEHEEDQLILVLLDGSGNVLAQKPTRVGADS